MVSPVPLVTLVSIRLFRLAISVLVLAKLRTLCYECMAERYISIFTTAAPCVNFYGWHPFINISLVGSLYNGQVCSLNTAIS